MRTPTRRTFATALTASALVLGPLVSPAQAGPGAIPVDRDQPSRPQFHFQPAKNWMNDPNGMVQYKGVYHLFFQHNPKGNDWGNMSWGHATSRDLVHWTEQPVAIRQTFNDKGESIEDIFSGSVVVDVDNTSGLGSRKNPAMVALYTSAYTDKHPTLAGRQAQSMAYSLDEGRTWTKYAGNPVLDIGSREFRDPKVFWYAPAREWRMVVVRATDHVVAVYGSKDLKQWAHLSDFGPQGATGGVWECPDLFELPVDGNPRRTKWVMVVNMNPGGIAGGSGGQYFVGDFDGKVFTADDPTGYAVPAGQSLQSFEGGFAPWAVTGSAFGASPSTGAETGQSPVTGFTGSQFANSFHGGDAATGMLRSPDFRVDRPYLNFLVGGGNHPHVPGTSLAPVQPSGVVFNDFESTSWGAGWTATGSFASDGPREGTIGDQQAVSGHEGRRLVNTFTDHDASTGTITSPTFTIDKSHVNFLVGGGNHPWGTDGKDAVAVNLVVDGRVVRTATGHDSEFTNWASWDVSDLKGKKATIQVVDNNTGGWGHILLDQITFADAPAVPVSIETAVNLVVDGKVVRSATGGDSEKLDWVGWDLREFAGKQAHVEVVDNNTGGWGHMMADDFQLADAPAQSSTQRAHWIDHGRDFYAGVTFSGMPAGQRVMMAWMNNWQYAGSVPSVPARSAMTLARSLSLRTVDGTVQLVSTPVRQFDRLLGEKALTARGVVRDGTTTLRTRKPLGQTYQVEAVFVPRSAARFGVNVAVGSGQRTAVGYDQTRRGMFVDRTASGNVGFNENFPSVEFAPMGTDSRGRVTLRILVDRSSVEVFGNGGRRTITDLVFPDASSTGVQVFSEGGSTTLEELTIRPVASTWSTARRS